MPDTIVKLGDFEFRDYEVPRSISFGGAQRLAVHELVGGTRVVDAMGRQDHPLEWQGRFQGQDATPRARYLDFLRIQGKPLELTWWEFRYRVVIAEYEAEFERFYQIPYRIRCVVVEDLASPTRASTLDSIDSAIRDGVTQSKSFIEQLSDGIRSTVEAVMAPVEAAISVVNDIANASQAVISSILTPLADAQQTVQQLIASVGNTVQNVTTVGGLFPNSPLARNANNLIQEAIAITDLANLTQLNGVLGGMNTNLNTLRGVGSGLEAVNTVTTAAGNLFGLAGRLYGDATRWTGLAEANGLTDPQLEGVNTLNVPANTQDSGGILAP